MQEGKPKRLAERTVDSAAFGRSALAAISQRTAASVRGVLLRWPLNTGCWLLKHFARSAASPADFIHKLKIAMKELKESRVWLLFASRLVPGAAVEALRTESRELMLMFGASINTATARTRQDRAIEA